MSLLDVLPERSALVNRDGRCLAVNSHFAKRFPETDVGTDGRHLSELLSRESWKRWQRACLAATASARMDLQGVLLDHSGQVIAPALSIARVAFAMASEDAFLLRFAETEETVQDQSVEIEEIRQLAHVDDLTGLANRRALFNELERRIDLMRDGTYDDLSVFYLDLDDFKKVNDLAGHTAGDEMLCLVANCLKAVFGEDGLAARLGGDEFVGLIQVATEAEALEIANRLQTRMKRLGLKSGSGFFTVKGSIGICYLKQDFSAQARVKPIDILHQADRACLRGKAEGGSAVNCQAFDPEEETRSLKVPSWQPEDLLMKDLSLHAMPIIALPSKAILGSEILLRLKGEKELVCTPRVLIASAERSGFMSQVDGWTLDQVLDAISICQSRRWFAVNLSMGALADKRQKDLLRSRLSSEPLLAGRLCLEISEKDYLRQPDLCEDFLRFVSELGCQTAIDDFAGHWPVLERLTELKVDWIKIDPALSTFASAHDRKRMILKRMIAAAHDLGIRVIAKNVEGKSELAFWQQLDVDAAQGFYVGSPEPWPDSAL
ncbi:EAL domain-containing protein [Labrenzia sp. CE80]|uniref:EAL domain-containing protein n=1 Tax=Labrenzia sp. CE80 TaxID=1788986 RepID=UPI00129ABD71|nr:EAL domain-containing protein [Labrenzia sp. CE80]